MKINFFAGENFTACGRKFFSMQKRKNRKAKRDGKESPYPMIVYRANFSSNIF